MKFNRRSINLFDKSYTYFHIDEFSRDAIVASALKKKLKEKGIHLLYGNRIVSLLVFKFPWLLSFCNSLIFPSVDVYKSYFFKNIKSNLEIFILPTESISGTRDTEYRLKLHLLGSDFDNNNFQLQFTKINKIFLWGNFHKKIITNQYPDLENKLLVIGHPRYDRDCINTYSKTRLQNKINIGFVSRFDLINIYDSRSNLDLIFNNRKIPGKIQYFQCDQRDQEDYYHNAVLDLRIIFLLLDSIDLNKFNVHLRVHPRENRSNWQKLINRNSIPLIISEYGQPFTHWLSGIDLVLSPPSTTFYDYSILGKSAILTDRICASRLNHASVVSDDFDPIFDHFKRPNSINETLELINNYKIGSNFCKVNNENELFEILYNEVNYPHQNYSLDKVTQEIVSTSLKGNFYNFFSYILFLNISLLFTYLFFWHRFINRKIDESANFLLTFRNIRKINSLVYQLENK